MDKKRQLRMLGWAALLPLFFLVWILSAEKPDLPGDKQAGEVMEDTRPEVAETPTGLSPEDKQAFRDWLIESSVVVTELEYPEGRDDHLQIKLQADKYTTQEAAEKIAFHLVRYYKMETGFIDPVKLTIVYPDKAGIFFEETY
ncbi:MAG TPA: hypothetical protein ENK51_03820 [Gammaproteobacteria bacterium]|nr:hypothetical protein [Gammaproteobacteria bacterium]